MRVPSGMTLYGLNGQSFGTAIDLLLADGTLYEDAASLGWLPMTEIIAYLSLAPNSITIGSTG